MTAGKGAAVRARSEDEAATRVQASARGPPRLTATLPPTLALTLTFSALTLTLTQTRAGERARPSRPPARRSAPTHPPSAARDAIWAGDAICAYAAGGGGGDARAGGS